MKKLILALAICFLSLIVVNAQGNRLISSNSVGGVRLGMTVAQARKVLKGYKLERTSDGDGAILIDVNKGKKSVMTFYAGEEDAGDTINERAKIEFIEVWDSGYKTAQGLSPQMLVKSAEKILGRVKEVRVSEIESRQFVTFTKKPRNFQFRIDYCGIYPNGKRGTKYESSCRIMSIQVSKNLL